MADNTEIAWADSTFNPWIGCTKVGPGCDNCYAEADFDKRRGRVKWGAGNPRSKTKTWGDPVKWNKQPFCECMNCGWRGELRAGALIKNPEGFHPPVDAMRACTSCNLYLLKEARRRVFCASLADVFDNEVPTEWRLDLFDLIETTENLSWLLLTKRIGNVAAMIKSRWSHKLPNNVWLGATICNQEEADRDIPKLLQMPAAIRWISVEPMLGAVDLSKYLGEISWNVIGGESGRNARPMNIEWAKDIVRQCKAAGIPVLMKQLGAKPIDREGQPYKVSDSHGSIMAEFPEELRIREYPVKP